MASNAATECSEIKSALENMETWDRRNISTPFFQTTGCKDSIWLKNSYKVNRPLQACVVWQDRVFITPLIFWQAAPVPIYSYNHLKLIHQKTGRISWLVSGHRSCGAEDSTQGSKQAPKGKGRLCRAGFTTAQREERGKNANRGDFCSSRPQRNFIILSRTLPKHILNLRINIFLGGMYITTKMRQNYIVKTYYGSKHIW